MNNIKKIMLIPPQMLPIPNVGGGAIETLITNLLTQNEKERKVHFVVVSKYDCEAALHKFLYSTIYYHNNDLNRFVNVKSVVSRYKLYRFRTFILKKIICNRITYRFFKKNVRISSYFSYQCLHIAKHEKIDYLVSEGPITEGCELVARYVGSKNSFCHIHHAASPNPYLQSLFPNSISISSFVKNKWLSNGFLKGKHYVLYNGVDESLFPMIKTENEVVEFKNNNNLSLNKVTLLYCGRIIQEKGVMELIKSFILLNDKDSQLIIVGSVNFSLPDTDDYYEAIMNLVNTNENIYYLGYIPNDQLSIIYQSSDILVVPSLCQEGAGMVAIEGMMNGLALITTKVGGMVEYVDSNCSIQIEANDEIIGSLCRSMKWLINDHAKRKAMSNASILRAKMYTKMSFYYNFIKIFE